MKRSSIKYFLGFLVLVIFLSKDALPVITHLFVPGGWDMPYELTEQPESENAGKGAEPVRESEPTEYWTEAVAGTFPFSEYFLCSPVTGQQDTFINQQVYLSIPTPPPDVISC